MSNEYLDIFQVGTVNCLSLGNIEETNAVISYLKGEMPHVVPRTVYGLESEITGVFATLSSAYSDGYYLACINTYRNDDGQIETFIPDQTLLSTYQVPFNGDDSYTLVISSVPLTILQNNRDMIDFALIKAYGVRFISSDDTPVEPPEPDYPPVQNWDGGRTFLTIRDNDTFAELGLAYDLMNTRIYEELNNKYTLDFNILPYYNVYRIMHPNFVELNGDYFRVRRIEKNRNNTLMMAISCEHISYELNNQYELDMEDEEIELPDYPYEGTPREILSEMLQGTRFNIGTVQFNNVVQFTSKPMGIRSMIIGLANEIGAEVRWNKFTVSLVARRGADKNLSFEVGKNLISMTEVYEIHANGAYNRFYDVDVIDLSRIENENPQQDLYDIQLGDTVRLIDEQFNIDINQRVVSLEIDPFRKELPKIQLEHVRKNITSTIADVSSSITDLRRLKGGGSVGGGETTIRFINQVSRHFDSTVNPGNEIPMDIIDGPVGNSSYQIKVTENTVVTCGIVLTGTSTTPSTFNMYLLVNGNRVTPTFSQTVNAKSTLNIPISFALQAGEYQDVVLMGSVDNGNFEVLANQAHLYLKGNHITYQPLRDQS